MMRATVVVLLCSLFLLAHNVRAENPILLIQGGWDAVVAEAAIQHGGSDNSGAPGPIAGSDKKESGVIHAGQISITHPNTALAVLSDDGCDVAIVHPDGTRTELIKRHGQGMGLFTPKALRDLSVDVSGNPVVLEKGFTYEIEVTYSNTHWVPDNQPNKTDIDGVTIFVYQQAEKVYTRWRFDRANNALFLAEPDGESYGTFTEGSEIDEEAQPFDGDGHRIGLAAAAAGYARKSQDAAAAAGAGEVDKLLRYTLVAGQDECHHVVPHSGPRAGTAWKNEIDQLRTLITGAGVDVTRDGTPIDNLVSLSRPTHNTTKRNPYYERVWKEFCPLFGYDPEKTLEEQADHEPTDADADDILAKMNELAIELLKEDEKIPAE